MGVLKPAFQLCSYRRSCVSLLNCRLCQARIMICAKLDAEAIVDPSKMLAAGTDE